LESDATDEFLHTTESSDVVEISLVETRGKKIV